MQISKVLPEEREREREKTSVFKSLMVPQTNRILVWGQNSGVVGEVCDGVDGG